jgi:hypothetical protein
VNRRVARSDLALERKLLDSQKKFLVMGSRSKTESSIRVNEGEPILFRLTSSRRLVPYTLRTGPGYVASLRSLVTSVIPSTIA